MLHRLKKRLKSAISARNSYAEFATLRRVFEKADDRRAQLSDEAPLRVAVLPASSPGSLGDDAMLKGLMRFLERRDVEIIPIAYKDSDSWTFMQEPIGVLPDNLDEWIHFSEKLSGVRWIFINGADVLDGKYSVVKSLRRLKLAYVANYLGTNVTITGFSFRKNAPEIINKALFGLPEGTDIYSRDEDSYKRLRERPCDRVKLVADLAFLMEPDVSAMKTRAYYQWLRRQKSQNKKVLALNICAQTLDSREDKAVKSLLDVYERVIDNLLNARHDLSVLLVPHDYRGSVSDLTLSLTMNRRLGERHRGRIQVVDGLTQADEVKAIATVVDFAFSGRMHFSIACLGVGVPVACFSYQDKFSGLFKLFELDGELLPEFESTTVESFYSVVLKLIAHREAYSKRILRNIDKVKAMSARNFERFEASLT